MINTKTKGELGRRIEYDVEHDLFHPQNVYSDEYITPTFIEYVQELEQKLEQAEKDLSDYQFNYPAIKDLQKENAELKEKLNFSTQYYRGEKAKEQLAKAKEIITALLNVFVYDLADDEMDTGDIDTKIKAEQFLKEL